MSGPSQKRRNVLRALLSVAVLAVLAPFSGLARYFYRENAGQSQRQKIANIKDLSPGMAIFFSYPKTGDPKIDGDPFRQYVLLMTKDGKIRAYSRVCVHLWCLPTYAPDRGELVCPCHGSIYRDEDGVAIEGPASLQPYPYNALPMVKLEIDGNGDIYAVGIDGRIGLGREWRNRSPDENVVRV
jgi:Rieske Fe-S protein